MAAAPQLKNQPQVDIIALEAAAEEAAQATAAQPHTALTPERRLTPELAPPVPEAPPPQVIEQALQSLPQMTEQVISAPITNVVTYIQPTPIIQKQIQYIDRPVEVEQVQVVEVPQAIEVPRYEDVPEYYDVPVPYTVEVPVPYAVEKVVEVPVPVEVEKVVEIPEPYEVTKVVQVNALPTVSRACLCANPIVHSHPGLKVPTHGTMHQNIIAPRGELLPFVRVGQRIERSCCVL